MRHGAESDAGDQSPSGLGSKDKWLSYLSDYEVMAWK